MEKLQLELRVPRCSLGLTIFLGVLTVVMVAGTTLSIYDLFTRDAIIAPLLWLCFVALTVWQQVGEEGSFPRYFVSFLGTFFGTQFLEMEKHTDGTLEMKLEIRIFGRRYNRWSLPLDKIISIEWSAGQATDMAKRDMNDWDVCVWFKDDSAKQRPFKPGQSVYIIGPPRRKVLTEAFGLAVVDFLCRAGLPMKLESSASGRPMWVRG